MINYLNLNIPKTQATVISPSSYEFEFKFAANEIEVTNSLKILEATLDRKLAFRSHIKDQLRKACAKAAALRRLRRFVPQDFMIRLYKAYILPHLEYCSPLLLGIRKVEQGKMEDTIEYLLRTLLGVPKSTTYETLLKRAGIETLHQRRFFQSMILLFKCLNGQGPSYINNNFNIKQTKYNLRGNASRMELPHFNLEWGKRSFKYICAKQWNFIPSEVRESKDLNTFKHFLKTYTIYLFICLFIYQLIYVCV